MLIPEGRYGDLRTEQEIIRFGGLNKTNDYVDGELEDCDRVTGRGYPYLETDDYWERGSFIQGAIYGIAFYKGKQYAVKEGGTLFINGTETDVKAPDGTQRRSIYFSWRTRQYDPTNLVVIGEWMFYNDQYALNLETLTLRETSGQVKRQVVRNPSGGDDYALPTIAKGYENVIYSENPYDSTFRTPNPPDWGKALKPGQIVTVKADGLPEQVHTVRKVTIGSSGFGSMDIRMGVVEFEENIVFNEGQQWTRPGQSINDVVQVNNLEISFEIPVFSIYLDRDNRLWGASEGGDMIYASALGDMFNFSQYEGISTDGYAVAINSNGPFTGGCTLSDGVVFFKKDRVYKITGSYPEEYVLYEHEFPGVRPGAARSVVVIENVAYYLGEDGVYAYYGGDAPILISGKLGPYGPFQDGATDIVAGRAGRNYCIAGTMNGETTIYTYSLDDKAWYKRTVLAGTEEQRDYDWLVTAMVQDGQTLLLSLKKINSDYGYAMKVGPGSLETIRDPWGLEFKPFRDDPIRKKRPAKIHLRLALGTGSWVQVKLRKDDGQWQRIRTINAPVDKDDYWYESGYGERVVDIPINPGRCDVYRLRLEGEGRCRILALTRETRIGGTR